MADDRWGGMFDFDGDGKTDLAEEFLACEIIGEAVEEELRKRRNTPAEEENPDDPDAPDPGDPAPPPTSWRPF